VEWLRSLGMNHVGGVLERNPRLMGSALPTLQAKHAFIVDVWKRSVSEIEVFPQVLTYSLPYLRKRHGFLRAVGREDRGKLHRVLRTADYLFARKIAGRTVEEYQRFDAPELDGNEEGDAPSLDEVLPHASAFVEVSAADKFMEQRLATMARDQAKMQAIEHVRVAVQAFYTGATPDSAPSDAAPAAPSDPDAEASAAAAATGASEAGASEAGETAEAAGAAEVAGAAEAAEAVDVSLSSSEKA